MLDELASFISGGGQSPVERRAHDAAARPPDAARIAAALGVSREDDFLRLKRKMQVPQKRRRSAAPQGERGAEQARRGTSKPPLRVFVDEAPTLRTESEMPVLANDLGPVSLPTTRSDSDRSAAADVLVACSAPALALLHHPPLSREVLAVAPMDVSTPAPADSMSRESDGSARRRVANVSEPSRALESNLELLPVAAVAAMDRGCVASVVVGVDIAVVQSATMSRPAESGSGAQPGDTAAKSPAPVPMNRQQRRSLKRMQAAQAALDQAVAEHNSAATQAAAPPPKPTAAADPHWAIAKDPLARRPDVPAEVSVSASGGGRRSAGKKRRWGQEERSRSSQGSAAAQGAAPTASPVDGRLDVSEGGGSAVTEPPSGSAPSIADLSGVATVFAGNTERDGSPAAAVAAVPTGEAHGGSSPLSQLAWRTKRGKRGRPSVAPPSAAEPAPSPAPPGAMPARGPIPLLAGQGAAGSGQSSRPASQMAKPQLGRVPTSRPAPPSAPAPHAVADASRAATKGASGAPSRPLSAGGARASGGSSGGDGARGAAPAGALPTQKKKRLFLPPGVFEAMVSARPRPRD